MSQVLGFITVDKRGRAVFPLALRRELGLSEGTRLRIERSGDGTSTHTEGEEATRQFLNALKMR